MEYLRLILDIGLIFVVALISPVAGLSSCIDAALTFGIFDVDAVGSKLRRIVRKQRNRTDLDGHISCHMKWTDEKV